MLSRIIVLEKPSKWVKDSSVKPAERYDRGLETYSLTRQWVGHPRRISTDVDAAAICHYDTYGRDITLWLLIDE